MIKIDLDLKKSKVDIVFKTSQIKMIIKFNIHNLSVLIHKYL